MDYSIFLGENQEDYNDVDIMLQKVDIYTESIYREYMINTEESELKVMTESGTDEDLAFLCEEAKKSFSQKVSKTMKKIVESVSTFVNKIVTTIKEKYANKKIESALNSLEERIKADKRLANQTILIIDSEGIEKAFNVAIDKCHNVASKIKDGIEEGSSEILDKINEEINEINDTYQKKKKEIESKKREINMGFSIPYFRSRLKYTEKEKFSPNVFIKISDGASSLKEKLLLKLNTMIGHFNKEIWSVHLACLMDTFKKIKEKLTFKGSKSDESKENKKDKEKEVKRETEKSEKEKPKKEEVKEESAMGNSEKIDAINFEMEMMDDRFEDLFESVYLEAYTSYGGDPEDAFDGEIDYFYEGANLDARAYFKEFRKEYKTDMKQIKSEMREGKYSSAKIHLKRLEKSVQKTKALIRSCDSTTGSVVIGYFVHWVPTIKRDLLMSLIPFVGITAVAITRLVENIKGILDSIKETREKGESISIDNFNLYKNNLMNQMDTFLKAIKKMEELADKMDKAEDVLKKELKKEEKKK